MRPGAVLGPLRLGTAATPKPPWLQWRPQIAGLSTNGPTLCARDAPTHHLGEAARTTPHTAAHRRHLLNSRMHVAHVATNSGRSWFTAAWRGGHAQMTGPRALSGVGV